MMSSGKRVTSYTDKKENGDMIQLSIQSKSRAYVAFDHVNINPKNILTIQERVSPRVEAALDRLEAQGVRASIDLYPTYAEIKVHSETMASEAALLFAITTLSETTIGSTDNCLDTQAIVINTDDLRTKGVLASFESEDRGATKKEVELQEEHKSNKMMSKLKNFFSSKK